MIIGVPKELKAGETRVGLTPEWVKRLTEANHTVLIQTMAGKDSGFLDESYIEAGASIVTSIDEIYNQADLVVKVKELQPYENKLLKEDQMVMAWFHLAEDVDHEMLQALLDNKVVSLSMELIILPDGTRPTIKPMSEIAGTLAMLEAVKYAQYGYGGRGILLRKIPGIPSSDIVILGGGNAGLNAAEVAIGLGLHVTIVEASMSRIDFLNKHLPQADVIMWDQDIIAEVLKNNCEVLINTIYPMPGAKSLVSKEMVADMKSGSMIIDITGVGLIETSHYTTLDDPIYFENEVLHYCVPNMPALSPKTSTELMLMTTGNYILSIANNGLEEVIKKDEILKNCISTMNGKIVHSEVAENHGLLHKEIESLSMH